MILIPQIYLKNNKVVMPEGTRSPLFREEILSTARALKEAGAEALHVIDLGISPVGGASPHLAALKNIRTELDLGIYVGGAFKTAQEIEAFIAAGAELIVLGSVAYQQPNFLEQVAKRFPARVGVHVDIRGNRVTIPGYAVTANKTALDYTEYFVKEGIRHVFYSNVGAGGALSDEHFAATVHFCKQVPARIVCTSEVSSIGEIERMVKAAATAPRLDGLVLGRPLYEGRIDLHAAVAMVSDIMVASDDEATMTEM